MKYQWGVRFPTASSINGIAWLQPHVRIYYFSERKFLFSGKFPGIRIFDINFVFFNLYFCFQLLLQLAKKYKKSTIPAPYFVMVPLRIRNMIWNTIIGTTRWIHNAALKLPTFISNSCMHVSIFNLSSFYFRFFLMIHYSFPDCYKKDCKEFRPKSFSSKMVIVQSISAKVVFGRRFSAKVFRPKSLSSKFGRKTPFFQFDIRAMLLTMPRILTLYIRTD